MSYQRERDLFISQASKEGLDLNTITRLLRYASTLQRLAVAQCNGDWPYNGDRDRPNAMAVDCGNCGGTGTFSDVFMAAGQELPKCSLCHGNGKTWHRDEEADKRHDRRYAVCPKCEASGVAKAAMKRVQPKGSLKTAFYYECPDCRTQELVTALLRVQQPRVWAVFGGDPRGAVLRLSTPGYPYDECGKNGANGLYVPARRS
jgi:DnaJ-class molecular chaperone